VEPVNKKMHTLIPTQAFIMTRVLIAIVCLLLPIAISLPVKAIPSEAPLRVAFVFNFMKFIEWPAMDASQHITLCASTSDENTRTALAQLRGKTVNKRAINLVYLELDQLHSLNACHMLYITQVATSKHLQNPLPNGVVVVADEATALDDNVSIAILRKSDGRIEFTVNNDAVARAGVTISSQLLKLAKNWRGGQE